MNHARGAVIITYTSGVMFDPGRAPHITWNEVYAMNVIVFLFRFKHFSAIPS